jgi:pimeloyl-ACP methyl ester carboxylesterase
MKKFALIIAALRFLLSASYAQTTQPSIEPAACPIKVDSSFKTRCGYLIVPENRGKMNGKMIKLPFILVESKNPHKKKDPILFTAGGPGGSSLGWVTGATRHSVIADRDCIAFEQRGTRYALPNLWSSELDDAIKESYRKNLDKDSMVLEGVRRYKKALEAGGIDLSGYNTDETVADIQDLLTALQIDSVNLVGGSYSGGLMLAVLQKDPSRIRSLILDSPLPTFVHIDEDEPANFNEALDVLFLHVEKDSIGKTLYENLKEKFKAYFTSIGGKSFYIPYLEKGTTDSLNIEYTRNDLLDVIENRLFDPSQIKDVPYIITEMIKGHHRPYIEDRLDGIFQNGDAPSGMRISVYCADQAAYNNQEVIRQLHQAYPYMAGYHINDVYKSMCDCWLVPPIRPQTKQPFYSDKPALLSDGEMDNACRPLYIDMIHHYMPNSQRLLVINRSHMTGSKEMGDLIQQFLDNPYKKIVSNNKDIIAY